MVLISLVFLFVYLFGAYAYGAATVYSVRKISAVWAGPYRNLAGGNRPIDRPSLALFAISTTWFVLHTLVEFRNLTGDSQRDDLIDLATLIVFLFPPVIMHTVFNEAQCEGEPAPAPIFRRLLNAMYVIAPTLGVLTVAAIFRVIPRPDDFGPWIGGAIGGLFTLTSIYSTVLMLRRRQRTSSADQLRLRNVMIFLFIGLSGVFIALIFMREQVLLITILGHVTRSSPIYFLVASVYFENRFEFYDLVVKRALLILLTIVVLGLYLALVLPSLELLPVGAARPWLFAVALAPIAFFMPVLVARVERWLDRMWLGREFTPVDAVKQVLAAMQSAIDEVTLIKSTEARLSEIFGAPIAVLLGHEPAGNSIAEVDAVTPVSKQPVRIAVLSAPGTRRILSEDLALLRSLGGVFAFMLDNVRLQRRRQEQDQLAHELRLQSSRSELKALRAQINPHFLFNALNAIASLIHTDPGRADEVVEQLAEVFRYTLRRSDSEWAPLDQELTFARAYLDVEQARFGQRLTFTIDSDHTAPAPQIPSMLLQTLLENAVKHGVSQAREPGRIDVIVRTNAEQVTLEVRNTGPAHSTLDSGARDPAVARSGRSHSTHDRENAVVRSGQSGQAGQGEGFGLHSVRERLKGHFGERASFRLTRDETAGVTVAHVSMPAVKVAA